MPPLLNITQQTIAKGKNYIYSFTDFQIQPQAVLIVYKYLFLEKIDTLKYAVI